MGFSSSHPNELVVGNSGTQMEGSIAVAAGRAAKPAPGAVVQTFATQDGHGFATLDRAGDTWRLTEWNVAGEPVQVCELSGRARLSCEAPLRR